jgi:hypothetical protein
MKTTRLRPLLVPLALLVFSTSAFADLTYTFSTDPPSGNIQGPAGSTIGWGYSITNNSATDWLVTTSIAADAFSDGVADASPFFDIPTIAPLSTASLPYDPSTDTGLYALTWDASAPMGFVDSGVFTLSADWYTGDPFAGGTFDQHAADETANYSATVGPAAVASVPEPISAGLLLTMVLLLLSHGRDVAGGSPLARLAALFRR